MRNSTFGVFARLVLALTMFPVSAAATPITIDNFEDGTTMGWFVPDPTNPNPPSNIFSGGPAGPGDNYLQLVASGANFGPGSRLAVLNESQWTGDYLAAGITAIRMDVNNFGPNDLVLRLLFENFGPIPFTPPTDIALTVAGILVPAGSGWTSVVFDLSLANLAVETFGTVSGALSDVDTLRIFHNPAPAFPGPGAGIPRVAATLGVDNITAVPDQPATLVLLASGLAAVVAHGKRRGR